MGDGPAAFGNCGSWDRDGISDLCLDIHSDIGPSIAEIVVTFSEVAAPGSWTSFGGLLLIAESLRWVRRTD